MLNQEDAIKMVEDTVKLKCISCKESEDYYIVNCEPDNLDPKYHGKFLDGIFVIYKDTKKIELYNPLILNKRD